ncbi:hypothetical protein TWF173_000664 [Orbilia oligospora]|nr:hypothetical protein TWF173_000664 [Orbilia oligospora]
MAPLILIRSLGAGAFHLNLRDKIGHCRGPSRSEVSKGMSRVKSRRMAPNNSKSQGFYFSSWFKSRKNQPMPQTGLEYRRIKVILRHDGAVGTVLRSVRAASNYWRLLEHASSIYRGWDSGCEQLATITRQQTGYWLKDEQVRELEEPGTGANRVGHPMEDSQHDEARIMPAYL